MAIQVVLEGEETQAAAEALLQIPGVSGQLEAEGEAQKTEPLTTVATIVGIVGGAIAIAAQIRKWYQECRKSRSGKTFDVLIDGSNGRILLEDATIEEISTILEALDR